jgi:hypothetical protein
LQCQILVVWTLDELVERIGKALSSGYAGAPNHRVRDVPDRRAVRWYTTIGLVDRPAAMQGRTALYGPRHLLQVVAVKRRQAAGRTLAEIQADLAGATDAELAAVASVPAELLEDGDGPPSRPVRARFWAHPATGPGPSGSSERSVQAGHATRLAATGAAIAGDSPSSADVSAAEAAPTSEAVKPLAAVDLGGGALLLVPGTPAPDDYTQIAAAARPLIDLLARRGLLDHADVRSTR